MGWPLRAGFQQYLDGVHLGRSAPECSKIDQRGSARTAQASEARFEPTSARKLGARGPCFDENPSLLKLIAATTFGGGQNDVADIGQIRCRPARHPRSVFLVLGGANSRIPAGAAGPPCKIGRRPRAARCARFLWWSTALMRRPPSAACVRCVRWPTGGTLRRRQRPGAGTPSWAHTAAVPPMRAFCPLGAWCRDGPQEC